MDDENNKVSLEELHKAIAEIQEQMQKTLADQSETVQGDVSSTIEDIIDVEDTPDDASGEHECDSQQESGPLAGAGELTEESAAEDVGYGYESEAATGASEYDYLPQADSLPVYEEIPPDVADAFYVTGSTAAEAESEENDCATGDCEDDTAAVAKEAELPHEPEDILFTNNNDSEGDIPEAEEKQSVPESSDPDEMVVPRPEYISEDTEFSVPEPPLALTRMHEEMARAVIGYESVVDDLLIAMLAGGHVLLEGYPGIAKTTLAKAFTKVLGIGYTRIQFTPDMLPQDITGHYYFNQKTAAFEVRTGPIFTNLLLADEINRSTPKTQSALLEAMQESQVTIEGNTMPLPHPFMVIATTNPLEHEGVYTLPIAQSDRFMFKVKMRYISPELEMDILRLKMHSREIPELEQVSLKELENAYSDTFVDESILAYITDIIHATRTSALLSVGASPRASEHMLMASRARAAIKGRDYVTPDDVKYVAFPLLNHRILPSPEAGSEDVIVEEIIRRILDTVPVPVRKVKSE